MRAVFLWVETGAGDPLVLGLTLLGPGCGQESVSGLRASERPFYNSPAPAVWIAVSLNYRPRSPLDREHYWRQSSMVDPSVLLTRVLPQ